MMSHQQLFEPALTGEPPARDTLDSLVRRSRRRVRLRRLTAAGAGLVAAGVVALVALPGALAPVEAGAPPTASASDRPSDVLLGEDPTESGRAASDRLTDTITAAVKRVAPSGWHDPMMIRHEVLPSTTGADVDAPQATVSYEFTTQLHVDGVEGTLVVTIKRRSVVAECAAGYPADVQPPVLRSQCAEPGRPDVTGTVNDGHSGLLRYVVSRDRTDGTSISVSASNEPSRTGLPPLTGEQVAAIAHDPGLTLYP
jgi:hypothetical protein